MSHRIEDFQSYLRVLARAHLHADVRGRLEVSDLVQQTLLEAHRDEHQFRGQTPAQRAAWLRRMLANKIMNAVRDQRRAKRDHAREQSLDQLSPGSEAPARLASRLAAEQPTPSEVIAKQEQWLAVARAIEELTSDQQQALVLRFFDGCALVEIAEHMQRTPAAVAGLLSRGLSELERRMRGKESS